MASLASTETKISKMNNLPKDPFAPSVVVQPTTSPRNTSRDVTIPDLPELFDPDFLNKLLPKPEASEPTPKAPEAKKSAFMDALNKEENKQFTQNLAHGFKSTGSATLDAFNGLSQATAHKDYDGLLARSWEEDPLATLRIIWNLRSIHEGKSEREGFYRAWGWLYRNHPRTAILNLSALTEPLIEKKLKKKSKKEDVDDDLVLVEDEEKERVVRGMSHGYWKDPLNLLILAASGELSSSSRTFSSLHPPPTERNPNNHAKIIGRRTVFSGVRRSKSNNPAGGHRGHKSVDKKVPKPDTSSEERIAQALQLNAEKSAKAKEERAKRDRDAKSGMEQLLRNSKSFKALFVAVARMFADALERDVKILEQVADSTTADDERINLSFQLSLAAKYAPSLGCSHDRKTNISSAIAALLGERGALHVQYAPPAPRQAIPVEQMHTLRIAYTRWVISPLRRFMQIPETYMSTNRWTQLPYQRVGSTCMQKNKKLFIKHDKSRFSKYLRDVASGKKSISGGTLLPHTLLMEALDASNEDSGSANPEEVAVIEAQWKTLVDKLRESGNLEDCLAICDVSGSMGALGSHRGWKGPIDPIYPAVALSLVLSQVSREPWKNLFITFSETPEIVKLNPADGFIQSVNRMSNANWGMNTDFNAVFLKLILPLAVENKLSKDEMIKRLFVFSDMEFDQSTTFPGDLREAWTTEHEKVAKAFAEAGYDVPEIVYWNLNGAEGSKPVQADWEGVVCLSGFSSNMLKNFMEEGSVDALKEEMENLEIVEVEQAEGETNITTKPEKEKMTPEMFVKKALSRPSYATLVVED